MHSRTIQPARFEGDIPRIRPPAERRARRSGWDKSNLACWHGPPSGLIA